METTMNMRLEDGVLVQDNTSLGKPVRLNTHGHGTRPRGVVSAYVHGTNIPLFEGRKNKVICDGSMFTASKHFDIAPPINLPSYNTALNLENIVPLTTKERIDSLVCLFCVGVGGCGPEQSQVYDVDYTKWIDPDDLIPLRYQLADNDLSDSEPSFKAQYVDGTPIDEHLYASDNVIDVEVFVELKMSITKRDCRDYYIAHSGINDAKINTISLCTAYPKPYNGHTYYQEIRPLTKLNFSTESLIDLTKGIDIVYDLFY